MATLRNKRKLAAVTRKTQEENPRNGQSRNTSVPRINEDYIIQVSEEIEGRVTEKLSQEFSRTESRILGTLCKLDVFFLNQQIRTHSGTVPGTLRKTNVENQGTNEDESQSDPQPEVGPSVCQSRHSIDSDTGEAHDTMTGVIEQTSKGPYMVTGASGEIRHCRDMVKGIQGEIRCRPDMVTAATEENRKDPHMVTGATERHDILTGATGETRHDPHMVTGATAVQEEIPYCSSGISSGKQKKARTTSQPQFHSENTPATIEADQILLALQQLATNSNSANVKNNSNRFSKLPKSLTTTMPTFDGKSENFELFEDLFQTSLKIHNQLTEGEKVNYFHPLMHGDALQTFKNISSLDRENLTEILTVFPWKYVKPQSMATAKHKFQRLVFNPANQKLIDFLDELQKLAKYAFGVAAQVIIEQFIYAKMPPHLKKARNQAHLENCTYEQIVIHLEGELELNSLEYPDETQMNTVTHKQQIEGNPDNAGNINGDTNDSNPNNHKIDRNSRTLYPPCETCGKTNHSTERCYVGANAANRPLPWKNKPREQDAHDSITSCVQATAQHLN